MKFLNKKWKKIIFIGGIIVVSLYSLQLLIPLFVSFSALSTKDPTNSLKFLSYNVQFGANDESVQVITQCDADIVALQELTNIIYEGSSLTISEFATLLSYDYYAIPTISKVWEYGLAILSRYNITYSQLIPVRYDDMLSRGMLIAEINVNDTIVIVINTHLDVPFYYIQRYQHAKTILDNLDYTHPLVLMGDFNTPNSLLDITYWSLFTHLQDSWIVSGNVPFLGKTWHVSFPFIRIDYIWVNKLCTVVKGSTDLTWNLASSDHRGLSVRLSF